MFAEQVRANRQRLGLTQEELATNASLGVRTIRKIEAGLVEPRPVTVRLLADAFELAGIDRERFCRAASSGLTRASSRSAVATQRSGDASQSAKSTEPRQCLCALLGRTNVRLDDLQAQALFRAAIHAACPGLGAEAVDMWLEGLEAAAHWVQLLRRDQQRGPASEVPVRAVIAAALGIATAQVASC